MRVLGRGWSVVVGDEDGGIEYFNSTESSWYLYVAT